MTDRAGVLLAVVAVGADRSRRRPSCGSRRGRPRRARRPAARALAADGPAAARPAEAAGRISGGSSAWRAAWSCPRWPSWRRLGRRCRRRGGRAVLALAASIGGELTERYLFFARSSDRRCREGCRHEDRPRDSHSLLRRLRSLVRAKDGRLTRELLREPGPVRAGPGSRRQDPGRDHGDGLRLLLDGLRPDRPPPRRRGDQPHARRPTTRSTAAWPAPRAGRP